MLVLLHGGAFVGTLHDGRVSPLTGTGPEITALGEAMTAAFAGYCRGEG